MPVINALSRRTYLDTATSGKRRSGAPVSDVSDPAFMGRWQGRAGPEVGAPVAVSRSSLSRLTMRPESVPHAFLIIEELHKGLLRMTMRACCSSSVLSFLDRIVREHFQFTPIALPSRIVVVGAKEVL